MAPIMTEGQYVKDCRGDSVPSRRQKEKKVRYRNVNMALMGTERPTSDRQNAVWNDRNKYKMNRHHSSDVICNCSSCRIASDRPQNVMKKRAALAQEMRGLNEHLCTKKGGRRSRQYELDLEQSLYEDGTIPGVLYSYDAVPTTRSNIFGRLVAEAEMKYENEVFERLVKNEYEIVETSEEDSDEEFELI